MYITLLVVSLCLLQSNLAIEFDELPDQYCEQDKIPASALSQVEACYKLDHLELSNLNPFTECKRRLFASNESDENVKKQICGNEQLEQKVV